MYAPHAKHLRWRWSPLVPLMPFSDEPEFDYMSYNEQCKFILWQIPNRDPDCAYVLHYRSGSYRCWICTKVAFRISIVYGGNWWGCRPSTLFKSTCWCKSSAVKYPFPVSISLSLNNVTQWYSKTARFQAGTSLPYQPSFSTALEHYHGQLPNLLRYFCNNTNCLVSYCTIHSTFDHLTSTNTYTHHRLLPRRKNTHA